MFDYFLTTKISKIKNPDLFDSSRHLNLLSQTLHFRTEEGRETLIQQGETCDVNFSHESMQDRKWEVVPRDALTGTGGRRSTGTAGTSANSSGGKPSRLERCRAAKPGSDHGDLLGRCPVTFCSPSWSSANRVFHSPGQARLATCTRTGAWTRGRPSPGLWTHRIMWNSRVCWEAGRPVSDSSNVASAPLWCEFVYYYFLSFYLSFY